MRLTSSGSSGHITSISDIYVTLEAAAPVKILKRTSVCVSTILSPPIVSRCTIGNYKALDCVGDRVEILQSVHQKTDNRHTVENLTMSTIEFLFTVVSTHVCCW